MSGHTPGPWKWEKVEQKLYVTEFTLNGPDILCRYWYDKPPSADASLIAAAPAMYEALKSIVEFNDQHGLFSRNGNLMKDGRAALALASPQTSEG